MKGLRLALGTLTIVPVGDLGELSRRDARTAMAIAPLAALPVAAGVYLTMWLGTRLALPSLLIGILTVGVAAYLTRALHLDGLADVVDALGGGWTTERALDIMKKGDVGPMGAVALLVALGSQATVVAVNARAPLTVAAIWAASRVACTIVAASNLPAARPGGMGSLMARSVPGWLGAVMTLLMLGAVSAVSMLEHHHSLGVAGAGFVAVSAVLLLLQRARRSFGGVTGDVFGAAVEIMCTVWLVGLSVRGI